MLGSDKETDKGIWYSLRDDVKEQLATLGEKMVSYGRQKNWWITKRAFEAVMIFEISY
jgi:hypothetical protein